MTTTTSEVSVELSSVRRLLGSSLVMRLLVDTSVQLFYPFLPLFAAGLGITAVSMGRLIGVRTLVGLSAPVWGALADKRGYRVVMNGGLLAVVAGLVLLGISPPLKTGLGVLTAVCGMILMGAGFSAFVPNLFAYLSAQLPYSQRSRALGLLEMAWAVAGIVGVFMVGWAMDRWGWRVPLLVLAALLLLSSVAMRSFPKTKRDRTVEGKRTAVSWRKRVADFVYLGENGRSAWAVITATTLIMFGAFHLFGAYGQWLFVEYGLEARQLGTVALLMGVAALCASSSISLFGDRIGKRRGLWLGSLLAIGAFWLLPLLNMGLVVLVAGLFVAHFLFEFAVVNAMILATEQAPAQRGKMMTIWAAAGTVGVTTANLTGPPAYEAFGAVALALPSGAAFLLVWLLVQMVVKEGEIGD
jgi:predicted MFS family arabinose efflux permease